MNHIQQNNIDSLTELIRSGKAGSAISSPNPRVTFFKAGGGHHLYLIESGSKKYLARVNDYPLKNAWRVKEHEFQILKMIENLNIAPRAYYLDSTEGISGQQFIIVEFIEGNPIKEIKDAHVKSLAATLQKLHASIPFASSGDRIPPTDKLPYVCGVFDEFANGEDKRIEKYQDLQGIERIIEPYNRTVNALGNWFHSLTCFDECRTFSLCHADLKKENVLETPDGNTFLIDWECSGSDIPETDIGRLFSGCNFSIEQQELFISRYFTNPPDDRTRERITNIKTVLDFFKIMEDYILLRRKEWNPEPMLWEIMKFERHIKDIV